MNKSNCARIFLACPIIFRGRLEGPQQNLMIFGFECGNGWFELIFELSQKIETIAKTMKDEGCSEGSLPIVVQVKEKFGGLRFYMSNRTGDIPTLIAKAEEQSYQICERCGQAGKLSHDGGWCKTLCPECNKISQL